MGEVLEFDAVTFGYQRRTPRIVRDLTWWVPVGRTVLLGPNGAGKSTLLRLAAGALRPQRGRISVTGVGDSLARRDRAGYRRAVGWMPQATTPLAGLTAREQVAYAAWLKGAGKRQAWSDAAEALRAVGLAEMERERSARLSGGQLRRVGLAQLLVHDARVLLLDEPTAGLDPAQRRRFRELLTEVADDSHTVVVSTHQVDDLDDLFDNVVVLLGGVIVFSGTVAEFLEHAPVNGPRRAELAYGALVRAEV